MYPITRGGGGKRYLARAALCHTSLIIRHASQADVKYITFESQIALRVQYLNRDGSVTLSNFEINLNLTNSKSISYN